jgi:hypothetical protein
MFLNSGGPIFFFFFFNNKVNLNERFDFEFVREFKRLYKILGASQIRFYRIFIKGFLYQITKL